MPGLVGDLRFGLRVMRRTPGVTLAAVITLALGIGANSAVFSVVNAVLLRPLPYDHPERIVKLQNVPSTLSHNRGVPPQMLDWRDRFDSLESVAAYSPVSGGVNLTGEPEPERLEACEITADFFRTLGVSMTRGRAFDREDEKSGGSNHVVVISHRLWQRRFSSSDIVGQTIQLNAVPFTVVGVAPAGLRFPAAVDIWLPPAFGANRILTTPSIMYEVIGRLKPAATLAQTAGEMQGFAESLKGDSGHFAPLAEMMRVLPLHADLVQKVRPALVILLGAVAFVLLIACANVTNLLLARASSRRREIAIRTAVGASRPQLVRQMLSESLLLAVAGGGAGLLVALWGVDLLRAAGPAEIPRLQEVRLDAVVTSFTLAVSLLTGLVFGLAPALNASKVDLNEALKDGAATGRGLRLFGLRNLLVIGEVAMALVLLIGAGLLIKSFVRVLNVSPGFRADNVLTVAIDLPHARYPDVGRQSAFYQQLIDRIGALPAVRSVGATNGLPLASRSMAAFGFTVEGESARQPESGMPQDTYASYVVVTAGYLPTMGIPILQGRDFSVRDGQSAAPVVIVTQSMAERFWPNESPVGKRLALTLEKTPREIVGVAGDVKQWGLESDHQFSEVYVPFQQLPWPVNTIVIHTGSEVAGLADAVRSEAQAIDSDLPLYDIKTMRQRLSDSTAERRFTLALFGVFAALALALATIGVYGVTSYSVVQRTREIGIRTALGAGRRDLFWLITRRGLVLGLAGSGAGLIGAFALTRLLSGLLFGITATDTATFVLIPTVLTGVALGACFVPARRATKVDPMVALRYE